jgi:hypothetical protein
MSMHLFWYHNNAVKNQLFETQEYKTQLNDNMCMRNPKTEFRGVWNA